MINDHYKLSDNLFYREIKCRCGKCSGGFLDQEIIDFFELIRKKSGGKPLTITSGFRCEAHNLKVGGVKNSYHTKGKALDILFPSHISKQDFFKICSTYAMGCGLYDWGIHIDCGSIKKQWKG